MIRLKRSLCLFLVAAMIFALAACAGKTETASSNPSSDTGSSREQDVLNPEDQEFEEEESEEEESEEEESEEEEYPEEEESEEEESEEEESEEEESEEEESEEEESEEEESEEEEPEEEESEEEESEEEESEEEESEEEEPEEEEPEEEEPEEEPEEEKVWRPNPEKVEEVIFVDNNGKFEYKEVSWAGPAGYVIVVPAGDAEAQKSAKTLQKYYAATEKINLKIVTDNTAAVEKEILIGKTNRAASPKKLAESEVVAKLEGKKLVLCGGHFATTDSAVNRFVRLAPKSGKAYTFAVTTDFKSTVLGDYYYVWGDEFDGADIDFTKWDFEARMGGSTRNELSWQKDCIEVLDGRLVIRARRHFNPEQANVEYRSPYSTLHKYHMNYIYGYAEIRARIPFEKGIWPSFWSLNGCDIAEKKYGINYREGAKYGVEVDVYEVFGTDSLVVPNIHKWYNSTYNYWTENGLEQGENKNHTQFIGDRSSWDWKLHMDDVSILDQEYHLYGFEWTPTKMSMYVDGTEYMVFDITKSYDLCSDMTQYHTPLYNMFNCHVFIDDPENTFVPNLITDNLEVLPTEYCIDWYRVYQRKDGKSKIYVDNEPRDFEYTGRY